MAPSDEVDTGWLTSRRSGRFISSMREVFGPMKLTSDITSSSRMASSGGLVTCANSCLK
jgi:hypothetical protein